MSVLDYLVRPRCQGEAVGPRALVALLPQETYRTAGSSTNDFFLASHLDGRSMIGSSNLTMRAWPVARSILNAPLGLMWEKRTSGQQVG